jgi:hypothetical protein
MKVSFGFAFKILPGCDEKFALLQAQSIRQYGGTHKSSPIFAMLPRYETGKLNPDILAALHKLEVEIVPFDYYTSEQIVYYTTKSMAAGAAEAYATGKVEQLIYSDVETLYLNDPTLMALSKSRKIGIRPVDVRHIGSLWDAPVDDFWVNLYRLLRVNVNNVFPVISTIDSVKLRTYFNACLITVKPENGLLQKWSANLARLRDNPVWNQFFAKDELYRVFLHQAILAGTILTAVCEDDIEQYPVQVNFPLYSYPRHPNKPAWINDLITCRLDLLGSDACWKTWLPMQEPVRSWLISQIEELQLDLPQETSA